MTTPINPNAELFDDDDTPNGRRHSILVYAVEADGLRFRRQLSDPLLSSPNHLAIAPDGDIYVSNDRRDGSSVLELAADKAGWGTSLPEGRGRGIAVAESFGFKAQVPAPCAPARSPSSTRPSRRMITPTPTRMASAAIRPPSARRTPQGLPPRTMISATAVLHRMRAPARRAPQPL